MEQEKLNQYANEMDTKLKYQGFNEETRKDVVEKILQGRTTFTSSYHNPDMGGNKVTYELQFAPSKNQPEGRSYHQATEVLVEMSNGQTQYNRFSNYFGLTALEMYNSLANEAAVLKTNLPKTGSKEINTLEQFEQQDTQQTTFSSWVKPDFSADRKEDGSLPMKFYPDDFNVIEKVGVLNVEEAVNSKTLDKICSFLEKGSRVELTNLNPEGEKKIRVQIDPTIKGARLYTQEGQLIENKDMYLKPDYHFKVGAVIEFARPTGTERGAFENMRTSVTPEMMNEQLNKLGQYRDMAISNMPFPEKKSEVVELAGNSKRPTNSPKEESETGKVKLNGRKNKREVAAEGTGKGISHT